MLHPDVHRFQSPIRGWGLVAARLIPEGSVVCNPGEGEQQLALTHRQLRNLPAEYHHLAYRRGERYVLCLDGSQYMNHSCDPNLWWIDDDTLVARRDIQPGEEVSYDYATSDCHPWWRPKWECNCGAACCRKVISGRDCLDPAFHERYRGHLPSWVLEFIARNRGARGAAWAGLNWLAENVRTAKRAVRGSGP